MSGRLKKEGLIIEKSIAKLINWSEAHNYKGYDPGDGLTSFLRPLTFKKLLLERILMQIIWKSPVNLRPLLGVKPLDSCIARGFFARGYMQLFKLTGETRFKDGALNCLNWLIDNKSPSTGEFAWGKMFDFSSRGGRQKKDEPNTIWTSLIGQAFLDAYEMLGVEYYLKVAKSVCNWIMSVPRTKTEKGNCINYTASTTEKCTVHNQSMEAAFMLAKTAHYTGNKELIEVAREAVRFTCKSQRPDGSWFYGQDKKFHWIDNFHTAYILDGLKGFIEYTGDQTLKSVLEKGYSYYKRVFFAEEGKPKYYHNSLYPIDIQCAAQAIDTMTNFSEIDNEALPIALKVAIWTILNMQDEDGHFYYRVYPLIKSKTPMIHWGQATMFKALASLLFVLRR